MPYSETSIEGRFLDGHPEAVGTVSRWIALVLTSALFRSLRQDRGDLHQETMARVVEALREGRFEAGRDLRVYVQAIARRTAIRALLVRSRERPTETGEMPAPRAENRSPEGSRRIIVEEILSNMSGSCRALVVSYFLEERSYEEIALELGVPIGTVKSRLFRCLEAAQAELSARLPTRPVRARGSSPARRD